MASGSENFRGRAASEPSRTQRLRSMRNVHDAGIKPSEITPESAYLSRRELLAGAVATALLPSIAPPASAATIPASGEYENVKKWPDSATDKVNSLQDITSYNNFYEFGTGKGDPAENAHTLKPSP